VETASQVAPQRVTMKLSSGVDVKVVELLRSGQKPAFTCRNQVLQFTVSSLADYEVAAITVG
jgi:hypothetical protein